MSVHKIILNFFCNVSGDKFIKINSSTKNFEKQDNESDILISKPVKIWTIYDLNEKSLLDYDKEINKLIGKYSVNYNVHGKRKTKIYNIDNYKEIFQLILNYNCKIPNIKLTSNFDPLTIIKELNDFKEKFDTKHSIYNIDQKIIDNEIESNYNPKNDKYRKDDFVCSDNEIESGEEYLESSDNEIEYTEKYSESIELNRYNFLMTQIDNLKNEIQNLKRTLKKRKINISMNELKSKRNRM